MFYRKIYKGLIWVWERPLYHLFDGQENRWGRDGLFGQKEYQMLLRRADVVIICNNRPKPAEGMEGVVRAMNLRNHAIVNVSNLVFGICEGNPWDGNCKGGSAKCLKYADAKGKEIFLFDPFKLAGGYALHDGK